MLISWREYKETLLKLALDCETSLTKNALRIWTSLSLSKRTLRFNQIEISKKFRGSDNISINYYCASVVQWLARLTTNLLAQVRLRTRQSVHRSPSCSSSSWLINGFLAKPWEGKLWKPGYHSSPVSQDNWLICTAGSKAYMNGYERPRLRAATAYAPFYFYYVTTDLTSTTHNNGFKTIGKLFRSNEAKYLFFNNQE